MKSTVEGEWGDPPLSTTEAAAWLEERLPEGEDYWRVMLVNNRRENRNPPFRIATCRVRGQVFYEKAALEAFLEFERRRRPGGRALTGQAARVLMAYGLETPAGGAFGQKFPHYTVRRLDDPSALVQLVLEEPLQVFRLTPAEARALGKKLTEAGEAPQSKGSQLG